MEVFERYKWYIFAGFVLMGLALGLAIHALMFGIILGTAIGFLALAFIAAVIKVNFKQ